MCCTDEVVEHDICWCIQAETVLCGRKRGAGGTVGCVYFHGLMIRGSYTWIIMLRLTEEGEIDAEV